MMTTPEERHTAKLQADAALVKATSIRERADKIAAGWVKSRQDNNFRLMLRTMGQRADHGT